MTFNEKFNQILKKRNSLLCVGLDTDMQRLPDHIRSDNEPLLQFNKKIIEATADYAAAFKLNFAFYEKHGSLGWETMKKTIDIIPDDILIIADAKRGDIGNTSQMYAEAIFDNLGFDAVTVNPYLGIDSVQPFISYQSLSILKNFSISRGFAVVKKQLTNTYDIAPCGYSINTCFLPG